MQQSLLLLLIVLGANGIDVYTGTQSYNKGCRVRGRLLCGDKPANDVDVTLYDIDFGPDRDDLLYRGYTDADGRFELAGYTTEGTTIDPQLTIYHDCNDGFRPCQRQWKFDLPNKYITAGRQPKKVLDIGEWNLEAVLPDEKRDCIH